MLGNHAMARLLGSPVDGGADALTDSARSRGDEAPAGPGRDIGALAFALGRDSFLGDRTERAVTDTVHRQPEDRSSAASEATEPPAADADLDAELDRLLVSLKAQPDPPPMEVIASTPVGRTSLGELTNAATLLWKRKRIPFSAALRKVAAQNLAGRGAPRPSHSPSGGDVAYARKAAIILAPFKYARSSDLSGYAHLVAKGSPFRKAVSAEYEPVTIVRDPTAAEMDAAIAAGITDLGKLLKPGQLGELMVNFQGHGSGGQLTGTDEKDLTPADLAAHAAVARLHGIKMLYVLDTCQSGPATIWGRGESARRAAESLPGGTKHPLVAAFSAYRKARFEIVNHTYRLFAAARKRIDRGLRGNARRRAIDERDLGRVKALGALSTALGAFPAALKALAKAFPGVDVAPLVKQARDAGMAVLLGFHALDSKRALMRVAASMGTLLDTSNDIGNRVVALIRRAAQDQQAGSKAPKTP